MCATETHNFEQGYLGHCPEPSLLNSCSNIAPLELKFLTLHCLWNNDFFSSLMNVNHFLTIDDLTFSFVGAREVFKCLIGYFLLFGYISLKLVQTEVSYPSYFELLSYHLWKILLFLFMLYVSLSIYCRTGPW